MAGEQKIGRRVVRSEPEVVFDAIQNCVVQMFVPPVSLDQETDNPPVVIQVNEPPMYPYGDERSAILPFNWGFKVHLVAGDRVWAVSPGDSMISFSAIPEGA